MSKKRDKQIEAIEAAAEKLADIFLWQIDEEKKKGGGRYKKQTRVIRPRVGPVIRNGKELEEQSRLPLQEGVSDDLPGIHSDDKTKS